MLRTVRSHFSYFLKGFILGVVLVVVGAGAYYKKDTINHQFKRFSHISVQVPKFLKVSPYKHRIVENFDQPISAESGKSFGPDGAFTFELFRNGTFIIDGKSGYAWQKSDSYRDSAFIRSTKPLPKTYKIAITVGAIDYGLEKIEGLKQDSEYTEGPGNENGAYLVAITDEVPEGHHTNIWWHQHRSVVIDVDNNVWGHGGPNPIFMVYFNEDNKFRAVDGATNEWTKDWNSALQHELGKWYKVEVERSKTHYTLTTYSKEGKLLKQGKIAIKDGVWHGNGDYEEYFVVGDPHENYYQGSMKIEQISLEY